MRQWLHDTHYDMKQLYKHMPQLKERQLKIHVVKKIYIQRIFEKTIHKTLEDHKWSTDHKLGNTFCKVFRTEETYHKLLMDIHTN
jgi:hypothetical protein